MILTQETLNLQFPPDPLPDTRYTVGWYIEGLREHIKVYDKICKKIVYACNFRQGKLEIHKGQQITVKKKHYLHIQRHYGKSECDPPRQINPLFYSNL